MRNFKCSCFLFMLLICNSILIVGVVFFHSIMESWTAPRYVDTFTSPSKENKVVVFNTGFLDDIYRAYPVKWRFFYKEQDNGGFENMRREPLTVTWETDNKAIIRTSSSKEKKIIVEFNTN